MSPKAVPGEFNLSSDNEEKRNPDCSICHAWKAAGSGEQGDATSVLYGAGSVVSFCLGKKNSLPPLDFMRIKKRKPN